MNAQGLSIANIRLCIIALQAIQFSQIVENLRLPCAIAYLCGKGQRFFTEQGSLSQISGNIASRTQPNQARDCQRRIVVFTCQLAAFSEIALAQIQFTPIKTARGSSSPLDLSADCNG